MRTVNWNMCVGVWLRVRITKVTAICRDSTAVARKLAWFVSSKSFVPPFLTSMTLCPVLFGGYWYSSPYMEHMILAVETIALFTRCRLTTISLHFPSECSAWHVLLHGNIIVVATSLPAALKQHNSDQLSANCGQVLAHNFFFFFLRSSWATCWEQWWCHFYPRWKFCSVRRNSLFSQIQHLNCQNI